MDKVSLDVAEQEIESWLDHKKIRAKKREANADQIEVLVEAVQDGSLTFDEESGKLIQILSEPLGNNEHRDKLSFKPRLKIGDLHRHTKGVQAGDGDGRLLAYISALTDEPKALIQDMDSTDYSISASIAIFFM